ncbi:uncharacterized protein LOC132897980 isoform X2 [Neoarius graeffei]|uniref:uncharacterized protein LOC132897980 isoform X2 n=1 Tax=Neoarius graeffei TaxID=443677 RepID=UPI00298D56D1|nr:uncharacterized protein LOC132897980 isoform X2 [Neoarius graeffei]XP_060795281.1 uncharacterized protein LOC132897980 isoform X2 [Neoarius graeffei]
METPLLSCVYMLLLVVICNGFNVQGPSDPFIIQLGGSVMLPCFVDTPLPMEELEVEWKRNDSETLVHLWQNGESRPESQNQHYQERAHFFTEEIIHGNFSLFLTNVTREDVGVYKCVVYTNMDYNKTLIEIKEIEHLIVSGAHVISAYAGEDITLNCSVDSHIPPENIEVSWKKMDEDILVLLYQDGVVLTESSHERYKDRVEFVEERNKGNFSMRLKDAQTEDKGLYMCFAFCGELSDNTTVEVLPLDFSSTHIGIFLLCILGFVIGSLVLGYRSYILFKNNDDSSRALAIKCAHVLCPNITMFMVFILWGVTEGSFTEAATCAALNFARIFFLLWIAFHLKTFQDSSHLLINCLAIPLQYTVINVVANSSIIVDVWYKVNTEAKIVILTTLLLGPFLPLLYVIVIGCCGGTLQKQTYMSYILTEFSNILRIFPMIMMHLHHPSNMIVVGFSLLAFIWFLCHDIWKFPFLIWISVLMILEVLSASESIYSHYVVVNNTTERDALTCVTAFLHILTMMTLFTTLKSLAESDSTNTRTQQSLSYLVVYMFGTALVVFVNTVALLVELILKARNGQHTVDLRVILLPTECVFAMCCLALQISDFWMENRERFRKDKDRLCGCKQIQRNSPSHNHEHELEVLAPESEPSGS